VRRVSVPARYLTLPLLAALVLAGGVEQAPARGRAFSAPRDLRVVSYYPADGGWTTMWSSWRPERYDTDLARIASLGANTVRIIVPSDLFGYPEPDQLYLDRLRAMIELAAGHGLRAQLTLFDWHSADYADIAGSQSWARAVLAPYAGDERLACVELKNEIDTENPAALVWARNMIPFLQELLGRIPVTISVEGMHPLRHLNALKRALGAANPDFYTAHYFGGGGENAYWQLTELKRAVAPVPLWLGETGYPSAVGFAGYGDLPPSVQAQEAAQAHFLKTLGWAAWRAGLPPIGIWTYSDFEPGAIPGPPVQEAEYHFGLFRTDGSAKPAASVVRSLFTKSKPSLAFDNGFESPVVDAQGRPFPAEWSARVSSNVVAAQDASVARTGHASALLRSLDGRPGDGFLYVTPVAAAVPSGATVRASVWVLRRSPGAEIRLGIDWLNSDGRHYRTRETRLATSGSAWTQLVITARRPRAARSLRILLRTARSPGSVWFDDVRFSVAGSWKS
jgi:hypothetical protein